MPQQSSKKPSNRIKNKYLTYISITVVSIIFFCLLYVLNIFFTVKKIEVTGKPTLNLNGLSNLRNKKLLFLSAGNEEKNLLAANPNLKKIRIVKQFPNSLFIFVEENSYIAAIKLNSGYGYLDAEGKVVRKKKEIEPGVPIITFYQYFDYSALQSGERLNYIELITALFFLKSTKDLGLNVESIDISGSSMIVFNLKDEVKLRFTSEKSKEKQLHDLERIVGQFKIEAKAFKILDLRFDKPVVRF